MQNDNNAVLVEQGSDLINGVFTRSSKRPANFQLTSSRRPANVQLHYNNSSKRPAKFQQTFSKRPAIHMYFENICWKFAGRLLDRANTL